MEEDAPPLPKRQPLSLEDMIAKKEAEAQAQAKVCCVDTCVVSCLYALGTSFAIEFVTFVIKFVGLLLVK